MSVINTNVKSLIVQNAIKTNNRLMSTAMEQLSTGKRINSAKDDAAGLAVSENMTAQIRGLNMAVRNANDGISLLQTAEGAMIEQTNMLQRMRELAVQAANGTLSPTQRTYLDVEFNALTDEINRIGNNTQWNGMRLLTGEMGLNGDGKIAFQVGAGTTTTETISVKIGRMSSFPVTNSITPTASAAGKTDTKVVITTAAGVDIPITATITPTDTAAQVGAKLAAAINANASAASVVSAKADATTGKVTLSAVTAGPTGTFTLSNGAVGATTLTLAGTFASETNNSSNPALLGDFTTASVADPAKASLAINRVDGAIDAIANQRAVIGAGINRLTYAADNLSNISQNTSESRSRILDTDYAQATTELARTQIIQQASTAVLAQANAQPQSVLKLLQG